MGDPEVAARRFEGPERLGPYRLLAKLAEGGMGTVYLARMGGPAGFAKLAVVKELKEDLAGARRFAELFLDEARLAARLTHPNVVHTYGAGEEQGRLYIAMEYLDGQPWSRVRNRLHGARRLPIEVHLKVLADTLMGLHYAHGLKDYDGTPFNVVHCDMSPQNVFITYDGQVKVVDFGVARATSSQRETGGDLFMGKVAYCAPEQARGEKVDRRADVFAVGVMLWEALAGRRFALGNNVPDSLRARGAGQEPRIREVVPHAPAALVEICDRALSLSPDDRYPNANEFRVDLLGYLAQTGEENEGSRLGELVSEAFRAEAARVHALIEQGLRETTDALGPVADVSMAPSKNESTLEADLSRLASVTRAADEDNVSSIISSSLVEAASLVEVQNSRPVSIPPPPPPRSPLTPPRRPPVWLSVTVLVLSGGAFVVAWFGHSLGVPWATLPDGPSSEQVAARSRSTDDRPVAPTPKMVHVRVAATPASARITLDGDELEGNPFEAEHKLDHAVHTLEASAPGHVSARRLVAFDQDVRIDFQLARNPQDDDRDDSSRRRRRRARRRGSSSLELGTANAPTTSTTQPAAEPQASPPAVEEPAAPAPPAPEPEQRGMEIYDEDPY